MRPLQPCALHLSGAQFCGVDIEVLKDGLRLVIARRTIGKFLKWMIVAVVGTLIDAVMLYKTSSKCIIGLINHNNDIAGQPH